MKIPSMLALSLVLWSSALPRAHACLSVGPGGMIPAEIDHEDAIIIWDDANKVEHFVRRAKFQGMANDFAFLVPVPSKPEIVEVDDGAFSRADALVPKAPAAAAANVNVLMEKRVAGMDATVLEADNTAALMAWLKAHGYATRPAADEWLKKFVQAHFKIVAFKYAKDAGAHDIATKAVRISFSAPYPFYPYSEPSDASAPATRALNLYVFAPKKARGYLWEGKGKTDWNATSYAVSTFDAKAALAGVLPPDKIPSGLFLTAFVDHTQKRPPMAELFFEKAE